VERVEKQKQLSHSFHRPLEISQKARDFHISTASGGGQKLQTQKPGERKKTKTTIMGNAGDGGIPIGRPSFCVAYPAAQQPFITSELIPKGKPESQC
jgi:hypothetical protein